MSYKITTDNKILIDKIIVGTPIRTIGASEGDINSLIGVDVSLREHGSVLVYDDDVNQWIAQRKLQRQIVDGGEY